MYGKDIKKSKGAILNQNGVVIAETLICPHCGSPFVKSFNKEKFKLVNPGGHVRSICIACGGETCGRKACNVHTPFEKKIEIMEGIN